MVRGCTDSATDTQVRRGQSVRNCAPCEGQEVNQILPGRKHNLSSLDEDREGKRDREYKTISCAQKGGKTYSHTGCLNYSTVTLQTPVHF